MTSYEQYEFAWRENMIRLLAEGRLAEIDAVNLQVFLKEMGAREEAEVENRLALLTMHILKAMYQPEKATRSWFLTIREQRKHLKRILGKSKNLQKHAVEFWPEAYQEARVDTHYETEVPIAQMPKESQITLSQILDSDWYPDSVKGFKSVGV